MVEDLDLSEGDEVHVAVRPITPPTQRSAAEILADSPGKRAFQTAEEVDEYIRQERNTWHS